MTREEALERIKVRFDKWALDDEDMKAIQTLIPELKESEDERIRKLLVWQVHRNIEDETNDLAQSVYDGIKGHDPDIEESIEDWKKCLAWLEKQKEQEPAWSEEDQKSLNRAINICISDFGEECETARFLKSLPERFTLQPKQEWGEEDKKMLLSIINAFRNGTVSTIGQEQWLKNLPKRINPQPKPEWSEEDGEMLDSIIRVVCGVGIQPNGLREKQVSWLKSLRPSWKPSEEQIEALVAATLRYQSTGLESLYEDLKKLKYE